MRRLLILFCIVFVCAGCQSTKPLSIVHKDFRMEFLERNPHLPEDIRQAIRQGKVIRGMTKSQVEEVWGEPHWRGRNRWEYKGWRNIYILFDGDCVKSVNFYT